MEKTTFVQSSTFVAVLLTSVLPIMALLVTVLLFIGCRPNDRLTTYPAGGSAASEGRPAAGAELRLHPVDGPAAESTILPRANVDDEGKFVFSTYRPNDGAPAGTYKITVTWREPLATSDPEEIHPDEIAQQPLKIPDAYTDPDLTPLTVTINPETNTIPTIELPTK